MKKDRTPRAPRAGVKTSGAHGFVASLADLGHAAAAGPDDPFALSLARSRR